jgi:hypothetical protein
MNDQGAMKFLSPEKIREARKNKYRNWSMGRGWGLETQNDNMNFFPSKLNSNKFNSKYSFDKNHNLYPLLPKRSFMKNINMNYSIFNHDYTNNLKDLKFDQCNGNCSVLCSKATYQEYIRKENELDQKIPNSGFRSIVILIVCVIISLLQYSFYRKLSNNILTLDKFNIKIKEPHKNSMNIYLNISNLFYKNNSTFTFSSLKNYSEYLFPQSFLTNSTNLNFLQYSQGFQELNFVAWKYQITLLLLIFYIYISGLFIKNKYINQNKHNSQDSKNFFNINNIHMISLSKAFRTYFNQNSLKISTLCALSYFLLNLSTKYLPITLSLILFNSGGVVSQVFYYNKENKFFFYKVGLFILVSSICFFTFLNEDHGISQVLRYDKSYYSLAILSLISASLLMKYTTSEISSYMANYSPMEFGFIIILNSAIITSFSFVTIELIITGSISNKILFWLVDIKNCFLYVFFLGILSSSGIILNFYMSIYLNKEMIKLFVYIEIILADFFSVQIFGLYNYPISSTYYFIIFSFLIAKYLTEYEKNEFSIQSEKVIQ